MAYPYYQNPYQTYYQPAYQQYAQPNMQQQQIPQQNYNPTQQSYVPNNNQVVNGGFVTVRSEAEARAYPVAPGTSITFKNESAPYCYTKTMGFSQLEAPRFEKFRLVKEEDTEKTEDGGKEEPKQEYARLSDFTVAVEALKSLDGIVSAVKADVDNLKTDVYGLAGKKKPVKKAEAEDE